MYVKILWISLALAAYQARRGFCFFFCFFLGGFCDFFICRSFICSDRSNLKKFSQSHPFCVKNIFRETKIVLFGSQVSTMTTASVYAFLKVLLLPACKVAAQVTHSGCIDFVRVFEINNYF